MLSACSPVYVLRAAYEEGKILWRRQPIVDYIQKPDVEPRPKKIENRSWRCASMRATSLKLNVGGSYASYSYVDRPDLTYIVLAAPKTELRPYTWWFLIVGSVPYKGYFSKADAEREVERSKSRWLRYQHAHFGGVQHARLVRRSACCRICCAYDKVVLAEMVFHELFHKRCTSKAPAPLTKASANFIGHRAAIDFFRDQVRRRTAKSIGAPSKVGPRNGSSARLSLKSCADVDRALRQRHAARRQAAPARRSFHPQQGRMGAPHRRPAAAPLPGNLAASRSTTPC